MSRLFQSRRPSTAANTVLKKSVHGQRTQSSDGNVEADVATSSGSARLQPPDPTPQNPADILKGIHTNLLFRRLEEELPCNSGHHLSAVESDLRVVTEAIIRAVSNSPDFIISRLCSILEKLQKRSFSDGTFPEEVLTSQSFILKLLAQSLNARIPVPPPSTFGSGLNSEPSITAPQLPSPPSSLDSPFSPGSIPFLHEQKSTKQSVTSFRSESSSTSLTAPAPLDDKTVHYALDILTMFQRAGLDNVDKEGTEVYTWDAVEWDPVLHLSARLRKQVHSKGKVADPQRESVKEETDTARSPNQDQDTPSGHGTTLTPYDSARISVIPGGGATQGLEMQSTVRKQFMTYAHNYVDDEALHGSYFRNVMVLIRRYATRALYHLSLSNWPVIFDRIKAHMHVMADADNVMPTPSRGHFQSLGSLSWSPDTRSASSEEQTSGRAAVVTGGKVSGDMDMQLLSACIVDRTRLMAILQEYLSVFRETSTTAQGSTSLELRNAIFNWAVEFPREFNELWVPGLAQQSAFTSTSSGFSSKRRYAPVSPNSGFLFRGGRMNGQKGRGGQLDGLAERVFDMLNDSHREGNRRGAVLYPALAALICISPDRLDSAAGALEGNVKASSKNNFLVSLTLSLTTSTTFKLTTSMQSLFACFEIVRFAFLIPPPSHGEEEPSLRTVGAQLALELKNSLMNPPEPRPPFFASEEPIDVNFHAHCIAAIFRFHPEAALSDMIQLCLEPERSQAVKLAVVKSLVLLVVEASKYPWQPSLEHVFPIVTHRLRNILISCASGHPEVIDGLRRPPSPFPTCSSVAVARSNGNDLANAINEDLRLRIQIDTLVPLEPRFRLYGFMDVDSTIILNYARLEHYRDIRERAAMVMALSASVTGLLNTPPDAPYYKEAMRYLKTIAPAAVIKAALMIIHAIGNHEFLRMGINVMHTVLTQLASGSIYDQDDTWRFTPDIMEAMILVETSLWCSVTSSQMWISNIARRCLRLMSIIQCHPAFPLPSYLSEAEFRERCVVLESLGDPQIIIGGRFAVQKHIRNHVSLITARTPAQSLAFREAMSRFSKLTKQIQQSGLSQHNGHSIPSHTFRDQLCEWQNVMYMVAVTARTGMDEEVNTVPDHLIALLPSPFRVSRGRTEMVDYFIEEVTHLLYSENVSIRQSAKDAFGNETNFGLLPMLTYHFHKTSKKLVGGSQEGSRSESGLLFVEQALVVIRLLMERIDHFTNVFEDYASDDGIMVGLYIAHLPLDIHSMRLRVLYCSTVSLLLEKRHCFSFHREIELRHYLKDTLADWIEQFLDLSSVACHSNEFHHVVSIAQLAALRLFVLSVETLRIQPSDPVTSSDPSQVIPRDYHRYMATLMKMLAPVKKLSDTASSFDRISRNEETLNDDLAQELVISGIAHLLNNNSELYMKSCLERCYDTDIHLRVTFMKAFTRVLKLGTRFDQPRASVSADSQNTLCQMVRKNKRITLSIIQVCPSNEVETLLPVLMRVYNTRHALVDFLKTLIDLEVAGIASPSELFRSNTICNRMLAAFARQYGYGYLRRTLESLVNQMMQVPHGCSFELDPSKLRAGEDTKENAQTLMLIAQAFIDVIVESAVAIPPVIREICRHIAEVVSSVWPESKYHAVGAFMFLRFICPAIVSPKIVDIDIPKVTGQERSANIQRGLLLVAKIIQNLSNNVSFGKEAYLTILNPFLEKNIRTVTKFLSDTHTLTYLSHEEDDGDDESFDSGYDDIDSFILHRFLQDHGEKIGRVLWSQARPNSGDGTRFATVREAWAAIRTITTQSAIGPLILSEKDMVSHTRYQQFMRRNRDRDTDPLNEIFSSHSKIEGSVFVLTFAKINIDTIDFELLLYTILKAAAVSVARKADFDIIFDFTSFMARSRLPQAWLTFALELLPIDIRQRWRSAYILNVNSDAQAFLSNMFYLFSGLHIARMTTVVSSVAELQRYFPEHPTIMATSYPASLGTSQVVFEHIHQQINRRWTSVTLHIGADYLRTVSVKAMELSPTLSSRTVELIHMSDVDDIHRSSYDRRLILKRSRGGPSVTLEYSDCDVLLKSIQEAKQRSVATKRVPLLPASQTSDTRATLLAVGLLHACHSAEYVRSAAYELLTADCTRLNYPLDSQVPWRGSFIPANSLAFVINFSERISSFAPFMTLDFILQWSNGFSNATSVEKITCLQFISPWIRNMAIFTDPSSAHFDEPRVRDCIRLLINITIQEPEIYPILQRAIWIEIGKLPPAVLNIAIDELIRAAIDSESDSWRCDVVADTLIPVSTIHTRAKVLTRLRTTLSQALSKPTHNIMNTAEWKHMTVLSRLALVAGHSPRLVIQNQLYAAEIAHLITMLGGTGSLSMRLSTYGMAVNLLQSLHMARTDDEEAVIQLRQMLDDLKTPQALKLFGLNRPYPSSEIGILEPASNSISIESLEKIAEILLRALELGSQTVGLSNVWKARWMSLLIWTSVQPSFYGQFRSFTVISKFPNPDSNDEAVGAMLQVFQRNMTSPARDDEALIAFLHCLHKAVPFLPPKSRYLGSIFWFSVSILQAEQTQLYADVLQVLQVTVETMAKHGLFNHDTPGPQNPMAVVLMDVRSPLCEAAVKLDQLSELSFETDFGFALVAILWLGARVQAHLDRLASVLTTLLKISICAANPKAEPRRCLDATSMPLYLGLCTCMNREEYVRLLEEECHILNLSNDQPAADDDHEGAFRRWIDLEQLGLSDISDMKTVTIAITLIILLEDSFLVDLPDKEALHLLWSGIIKRYPTTSLSGAAYSMQHLTPERISNKLEILFSPSLSEFHFETVTLCFQALVAPNDESTLTSTPGESSTSLSHLDHDNTVTSPAAEPSRKNTFGEVLSECGMIGMLQTHRRPIGEKPKPNPEKMKQATGYVAELLSLILSQ